MSVIVALVAPLLVTNWALHGDPLYHANLHVGFYEGREFGSSVPGDSWSAYCVFRPK